MKYLKQIIIGVMVFLFYYFFSDIAFFLFDLFKFDYMNASRLVKIILIYSLELIPGWPERTDITLTQFKYSSFRVL